MNMNHHFITMNAKVEVKSHPFDGSPITTVTFPNGWGLSILSGGMFYASGDGSDFEVAIINPQGDIDYNLHGDVLRHQTQEEIHKIALQVSKISST